MRRVRDAGAMGRSYGVWGSGVLILCRVIGHRRKSCEGGTYYRFGRLRTRYYTRCERCGSSDAETIYTRGWLEPVIRWRWHLWQWGCRFQSWHKGEICTDCGKMCLRFGRDVGRHDTCDPIPF